MVSLVALITVCVMVWALINKYETRMVLIAGGLVLACVAGDPMATLKSFSASMKQANVFEVIVACMGFAAVVKLTGCHNHLIGLFVKVLRKCGPFTIMGAALATMVVNSAIPSAAGTSAAVGTILIPLLIAAKVPAPIAAATIMAGLYGGNLNPGHVHPTIVAELAGKTGFDFVAISAAPIVSSVVCSSIVLIGLSYYMRRKGLYADINVEEGEGGLPSDFRPNVILAIIPLLPLIMLLLGNMGVVKALKMPVSHAMIIGAVVAMIATRTNPAAITKEFFKGMGSSFGNIFGIIVAANIFVAGLKSCGIIAELIDYMTGAPGIAKIASIVGPFFVAILSGSGEAASIAFNNAVTAHAESFGLDIMNMGCMTVLSGGIGRSISPVAGAMIICAGLAKVSPMTVTRWIVLPMLCALACVTLMLYVF